MSILVANAKTGGDDASAAQTTLAATAFASTTGNTELVFVRWFQGTLTSVTDTAGNTYTPASGASVVAGNQVAAYICENATGNAANVVQANASPGLTFADIHVHEISGLATSANVDVAINASPAYTSATTTVNTGAFSTAQTSEIIFAFCSLNGGDQVDAGTPTIGGAAATWSTRITPTGFGLNNTGSCYVIESATESGIDAVFTIASGGAGGTADMVVVSLKGAGVAPANPAWTPPIIGAHYF